MKSDLRGRRVTVMGLGHFGGGAAVARWLARQGAEVTITDQADQHALADSLAELAGTPVAGLQLGGHREEGFRHADLVVVNPAVRPGDPFLEIARAAGVSRTSEIELFLEACPAAVIGVTGSNGKSTTAAMTATILQAAGRRTWLGGNIGASLLERLGQITADDWVVLELSSFQLFHLGVEAPMPRVAVVTSFSPNHLDWHPDCAHYKSAKQRLLVGQESGDLAVLNTLDAEVASWACLVRGRLVPLVPEDHVPPLRVPGEHNRTNARLAATVASAVGCPAEAIRQGLGSFATLPQRLELAGEIGGRRFYNDSSSTTPESTIAALDALDPPVWLLAGGKDKGADFGPLVAAIAERAHGAAFFGSVGRKLCAEVRARAPGFPCVAVETMEEALWWCWARSRPGESIALSPACSSHDQFQNFRQRGRRFDALVAALAERGD